VPCQRLGRRFASLSYGFENRGCVENAGEIAVRGATHETSETKRPDRRGYWQCYGWIPDT
jgi:hypothetical protein